MDSIQTVIEIASFEMMGHTRDFRSLNVEDVRTVIPEIFNRGSETVALAIVEENDSETILRIVQITSSPDRVHDELVVFAAAGNKDIDSRAIIANKSELRPVTLLKHEQGPEGLHENGQCHDYFDGDEDPCQWEWRVEFALSVNNERYSKAEICPVKNECEDG